MVGFAADCLSLCSSISILRNRHNINDVKLISSSSRRRRRIDRCCKASLITSPDSFEVGRLIGSYGFMNITSYSGLQSGMDLDYPPTDVGRFRTQDVGQGSVEISNFADFMKEELRKVHLEVILLSLRYIQENK